MMGAQPGTCFLTDDLLRGFDGMVPQIADQIRAYQQVGGGDVVPPMVREVVADLARREAAGEPLWMGIEA